MYLKNFYVLFHDMHIHPYDVNMQMPICTFQRYAYPSLRREYANAYLFIYLSKKHFFFKLENIAQMHFHEYMHVYLYILCVLTLHLVLCKYING